jgi:hypothetical protein
LVSPDFAAVPNFGQPVIETSEPCGKRSFVGRFIATSISVFARAFSHAVETRNDAAVVGNDAPSPSKAARTILTASNQVKIASWSLSSLIYLDLFRLGRAGHPPVAALQ